MIPEEILPATHRQNPNKPAVPSGRVQEGEKGKNFAPTDGFNPSFGDSGRRSGRDGYRREGGGRGFGRGRGRE